VTVGAKERRLTEIPPRAPKREGARRLLRLLAQRRLTEVQLWTRLERRGYAEDDIRACVDSCKRDGFIDDRLSRTSSLTDA
jgi:SOS response regulatory protein OraA/RecX